MGNLSKKAAKMLLQGATLVAEPCPYCKGVRVIKDGDALCTDCGREPKKQTVKTVAKSEDTVMERLEKKLDKMTQELENANTDDRQKILESIDTLASAISKLRR